jgi:hypothetical protein
LQVQIIALQHTVFSYAEMRVPEGHGMSSKMMTELLGHECWRVRKYFYQYPDTSNDYTVVK